MSSGCVDGCVDVDDELWRVDCNGLVSHGVSNEKLGSNGFVQEHGIRPRVARVALDDARAEQL